MGKKGVRYFLRGGNKKVKVGFFNFEVVVAVLGNHPEGLTMRKIADKSRIHYNTARSILFKLEEMSRVTATERKVIKGGMVKHYQLTPWRLN